MAASVGDIYQVYVNYTTTEGIVQNTFGFTCIQNVAGDAQVNLGAAFQTALVKNTSGGLLYGANNGLATTNLDVVDVKPGSLATYRRTYSSVAGSASTEMLPIQCSVVLTLQTALKGRSYRGRVYLSGLDTGSVDGSLINAAGQAIYATIGTQLLAVFGPAGSNADWRLAVISRFLNGVERPFPVATQVQTIAISTVVRTQRRRVRGVGS